MNHTRRVLVLTFKPKLSEITEITSVSVTKYQIDNIIDSMVDWVTAERILVLKNPE